VGEKTVIENRRARHDFHVEEDVEAGIELHGSEVKSLRLKQVDLEAGNLNCRILNREQ
jgi:SsrA-binding protein